MFNLKEQYKKGKREAIDAYWNERPSEKRQQEIEELTDECGDFMAADHGTSKADL